MMDCNKIESNFLDIETAKKFHETGLTKWIDESGIEPIMWARKWIKGADIELCWVHEISYHFTKEIGQIKDNDAKKIKELQKTKIFLVPIIMYFPAFSLNQIFRCLPEWFKQWDKSKTYGSFKSLYLDYPDRFTLNTAKEYLDFYYDLIDKHYGNFIKIFAEILLYLWGKGLLDNPKGGELWVLKK